VYDGARTANSLSYVSGAKRACPDRSNLRPSCAEIANPGPLGLLGFGLTPCSLCINAGLLPHEAVPVVVPLAFAYGGIAQLIAGVCEFRNGNTFALLPYFVRAFLVVFANLQWTIALAGSSSARQRSCYRLRSGES